MLPTTAPLSETAQPIRLEVRTTTGKVLHSYNTGLTDPAEALCWAINNWGPARSYRKPDGNGFWLNPALFVNDEPVADVLPRIQGAAK